MKFFVLSTVLATCAVSSLAGSLYSMGPPAANVCCPCINKEKNICGDGTACTPYCGIGRCNIVGCNCDDGCRHGLKTMQSKQQSLESYKNYLVEASESSDLFDITDANKDGIMTIYEWLDSPVRSTSDDETCSMLVGQWAKFDTENVGYLTKHQAITRKA